MRTNGLLPVIMVIALLFAVFIGHSQSHITGTPKSLVPEMPLDGGLFLLMSIGLIYGGKALYRKD